MDDLGDLSAFVAVARAGGIREAARVARVSASSLSEAVRRLETRHGVRLLNRTTRSVAPTEAGMRLLDRVGPALGEVTAALATIGASGNRPAGTLKINLPGSAMRLVMPAIIPGFLAAYPEIKVELVADESFVDVLAAGCDAGIRYEEKLEQDMIAIPIGPRIQRFATAASPAYWDRHGRPGHPRDLLDHPCLVARFASGRLTAPWDFVRDGETVRVDPKGPLIVSVNGGADLMVDVAVAGGGVVSLFEDWLRPHFADGKLEPVLEDWWESFSGPFLYYPGHRLVPPPLRAFVDYVKGASPSSARA
jgi:DNA-binding transcriptional LysR family regulator